MSRRSNEVQAAVNSAVGHLAPVHPGLRVQVVFKLAVDVVDDRLPAAGHTPQALGDGGGRGLSRGPGTSLPVAVVDGVTKPRGVNNGEQQLDASLLHQDLGLLHLTRVRRALASTFGGLLLSTAATRRWAEHERRPPAETHLDGLFDPVGRSRELWRVQVCQEQRVDQGGLAQPRLSWKKRKIKDK